MFPNLDDGIKQIADVVSVTTVFGTLMGILPSIAAIFSIAWSIVRLYETKTIQDLVQKYKDKNNANS